MSDALLEVKEVSVSLGGREIIRDINLKLPVGVHGVIGPNGAGKTTLLKAIAGIIDYEGEVTFNGRSLDPSNVSYMPATPVVDPLALVRDVMEAGLYNSRGGMEAAEYYMEMLGVKKYVGRRYNTLSSGEQRLVWIARTLGRLGRVVLLDESLSFLDVRNQSLLLKVLKRYAVENDAVILLATHEIHYAWFFDSVIVLRGGGITYSGPAPGLNREVLEATYNVKLREVGSQEYKVYIPVIGEPG